MFASWERSWHLVKASWSVLQSDKELVVFPIISFIGSIIVMITFAVPMLAAGIFDSISRDGAEGVGIAGLVIGFLFYLVMYTVVIFSNTALVGAAMIRLDGGDPTVRDGIRIASERFGSILGYALISATIGMILRWIAERGFIGQIVSSILGFAWNVVTFLAVPVMVVEKISPMEAVKRSGNLLKRTWGEQLVANAGIGLVFGLAIFLAIILGGVITAGAFGLSSGLGIVALLLMIAVIVGLSLLSSTLTGIYQAALYRYAANGETGGYFTADLIQDAFREKPKRGLI